MKMLLGAATVCLAAASLLGQSAAPKPASKTSNTTPPLKPGHVLPRRATMYYAGAWGIEDPQVKAVESGELIRFSYRVLDPVRAKPLNDKKLNPVLIDPQAGVKLVVPTLEKVGMLRQVSDPEAGKNYWMVFSNPGRRVKPGDRVLIEIGQFRADGLIVD